MSIVYYNKEPLFIDPGTKSYSNTEDSLLQKRTISHNTLSVDGDDQARLWGFFRWAHLPSDVNRSIQEGNEIKLTGMFKRSKEGDSFKHERRLVLNEGSLKIQDFVLGQGVHNIIINFILAPQITMNIEEKMVTLKGRVYNGLLRISSNFNYEIIQSLINIYPAYNLPQPSRKLSVKFKSVKLPFNSDIEIISN